MPQPIVTTQSAPTRADLAKCGFTSEQITRLETLAQRYPVIEFLDSTTEWQRLVFLRWRLITQRTSDG